MQQRRSNWRSRPDVPSENPPRVAWKGHAPASVASTRAAQASSRKRDTRPEMLLRRALWREGLRYRVDDRTLPGRPDIVIRRARIAIFCDGDFWHGRNLEERLAKLSVGHNGPYWVAKIRANVARDRWASAQLEGHGWTVMRIWEQDIVRDPAAAARRIVAAVRRGGRVAATQSLRRCQ